MQNEIYIGIFNTDERLLINSVAKKVKLTEFTRQSFVDDLSFILSITNDAMTMDMVHGLQAKVIQLTDAEWDIMKSKFPLFAPYNYESNVDEVPVDEEVI